jgi:hypothetical protein
LDICYLEKGISVFAETLSGTKNHEVYIQGKFQVKVPSFDFLAIGRAIGRKPSKTSAERKAYAYLCFGTFLVLPSLTYGEVSLQKLFLIGGVPS